MHFPLENQCSQLQGMSDLYGRPESLQRSEKLQTKYITTEIHQSLRAKLDVVKEKHQASLKY